LNSTAPPVRRNDIAWNVLPDFNARLYRSIGYFSHFFVGDFAAARWSKLVNSAAKA
jgi:hypothetical protein